MENISTPYTAEEQNTSEFLQNKRFLEDLEKTILHHRVFDHPFLKKLSSNAYNEEGVLFVLKQFGKIVMPFTGAICKLMGNAPDIKSRFMLMDNLYEEMGHNNLLTSHPMLYLKMLESLGVSQQMLEDTHTISSIRILNNTIYDAVSHGSFAIGCAWLGYGGELTIPNNFPYLVQGVKNTYGNKVDMGFWERHGHRDQEHSDDATTVLCMNCTASDYQTIEEAIRDSLNIRAIIWDELEQICDEKYALVLKIDGREQIPLSAEYKVLSDYYNALNNANINKMKENWSKEMPVVFTSPLGGIIRSYDHVISAHDELFNAPIQIDVEYYDIEINYFDNGFASVGRERGVMIINGESIEVGFRTSRLFVKEADGYKQVHHHGSFENFEIQSKIMQTLSKLSA